MQAFNEISDIDKEAKIKEYINSYIKELQRHFDMPDKTMRHVIYKVYRELSPMNYIDIFFKKTLSMIKSFYKKVKRK